MPFCGTLACAPEREVFTSLLGQGPFGGNIDCRDICAGHTIYLNAYHTGGLLYVGDMHGSQGDTEFTGIADETRATIQLSCRVIKDRHAPCVRIEKPDSLVAVGINLPMEHAVYDACNNMMEWFRDDYDISGKDMYIRMSCDPAFRVPHLSNGSRGDDPACRRRGISQGTASAGHVMSNAGKSVTNAPTRRRLRVGGGENCLRWANRAP